MCLRLVSVRCLVLVGLVSVRRCVIEALWLDLSIYKSFSLCGGGARAVPVGLSGR